MKRSWSIFPETFAVVPVTRTASGDEKLYRMEKRKTGGGCMKVVNQPVMKKDAMSLVTGKPVFLDDVVPDNALVVKVKRSPYAHALIEEIKIDTALKVPGIEAIYTYKDVPDIRFTMAGQTYPEPSPYDRLILDQRVRFVGDAVAIVAGENEKAV